MASPLLSSPSLSLSSQLSANIVISDLHHLIASASMQLQGSMQWLSNFPELINKFGMKSAITFLIEFVGKIGVKNVSEIAVISLIESISKIEFKNTSDIAIIFLTGRKKSNQKCSIDQDHNWNSLAQRIFELWRQRNDGEAPEISEAINPANCWPGYTTEYSEYLPEEVSSLQFFQWGVDAWEDVRHSLNCLEVRPQHRDQDIDQEEQEHEEESVRSRKRQRGMIDFRG
ncbi:hypothetical protein Cgig2_012752 [Carnegiea gigantea]|uniref:Uncharacterized protein n=1 Tax=Carnegiea gigantea TaxID=171969 RepID=A0A9Q1KCE7_9CARY|nr:hypothetical protein Cgig2_012752 [Carnegiea gigantea]